MSTPCLSMVNELNNNKKEKQSCNFNVESNFILLFPL